MENLKIRVNSEAERKEVQELFVVLGATCCSGLERNKNVNFLFMNSGFVTACKLQENFDKSKCKEITLAELRDLVVLKRNSIDDATHIDKIGEPWLVSGNNGFYSWADSGWMQERENVVLNYNPKPIEKSMKEWLNKETHEFFRSSSNLNDMWIEIPEGAECALFRQFDMKVEFRKGIQFFNNGLWATGAWSAGCCLPDGVSIIWQRHTQPEELPFIDDESSLSNSKIGRRAITVKIPVESLNNQYAEIEKVRQSAWQKQEGGNHYKNLKIQPMQYALENKLDYAQANVVKYVTRHKEKNGKEDLLKAIHNLELMIEFYYGDEK